MSNYSVEVKPSARKELEALPDSVLTRVVGKIESLGYAPRPTGCKKLKGYKEQWRVRVGDWRLVYIIDDRLPRGRGCPPYATFAPGLFPATAPYIVAQHADNSYVTGAAPAKPGEVIILWGTGFGPANPAVPAGQVFSGANRLANAAKVMIGGQPAAVDFAGVVGAGLVQINVHVPSSIGNGDAGVVASVGGASTQTTANMIPIHN